jgi:hypothetical protein
VPLYRTHHRALHRHGDEAAWWASVNLDPANVAQLWQQTRLEGVLGQQPDLPNRTEAIRRMVAQVLASSRKR